MNKDIPAPLCNQITLNSFRKLLHVRTEKDILEVIMQAGLELLGVDGASFVPYDEWGQTLPALTYGEVPSLTPQSWTQRLVLPETRQICKNCKALQSGSGCVLLTCMKSLSNFVHCFPFNCAGREVGVLNFYFDSDVTLDADASVFLIDILDAAGQSLATLQSHDRQLATLLYLQTITSPKSDLSVLLNGLLENVQRVLDVDFAVLFLPRGISGHTNSKPQLFSRTRQEANPDSSIPDLPFLLGIWKDASASGQSMSLENVVMNNIEPWKSLLAMPLVWRDEESVGLLVLGSNSRLAFTQRDLALLETLAGQTTLLIQSEWLRVQVEYQAVVNERTRLAREIHDGLAQTLAFLKIQAAQMQNLLARGESVKLTNMLQANYRTLSDAYIDARQAIDDLRRVPTTNFCDWISKLAIDYEQATNQEVIVSVKEFAAEYPANNQTQLIRIVQEALNNIRKHAAASQVNILGFQDGDSYLIEIRDNGRGFNPESGREEGLSSYGLQGMHERSESIGAKFQVTSQPGVGTCVSLRVPVAAKEDL